MENYKQWGTYNVHDPPSTDEQREETGRVLLGLKQTDMFEVIDVYKRQIYFHTSTKFGGSTLWNIRYDGDLYSFKY